MDPDLAALLHDYPVVITVPVWWGDQDAFGHVNNTVFLRWFESARIAYWDRIALDELMQTRRIGPILAAIACNFRRQVTFPDTVHVGARITRIGQSSLTMEHLVVGQADRAVVADGSSTVVVFDYNAHRSHPVPEEIRQAIETLEGRSLGSP